MMMSRESPTLLFGAADPSDDACTSSQFQINQITLKRRASIHSEYHSDSSEWRESSSSEQQQQESSDGSTRVGTSAEAWRSRMLDCCQDLVEDYSRWITYVCSTVVVLLGIIFALFLFRSSIRGWCTLWSPNDNNCVRLPLWLSGLSWIPMNNTAAVRSPDGSLFDGFVARYYCTSSASKPGHEPTWLFEQPVVLNRLSSSARQPRAELDLLVGILSACSNFKSRSAVRQTWMRFDTSKHGKWRAVFILGNCQHLAELEKEQLEHGDLLFTPVQESYYALTPKVLRFFDHAATVNARFALKTDDDTFVFIDRLLMELQGMSPSCLYWGSSHQGNLPPWAEVYGGEAATEQMHVVSVPTVKWYIPSEHFRRIQKVQYMAGGAYILSSDLVLKVAARNESVPDSLPEDVAVAALMGRQDDCSCADSRHIKDVDEFQGIRLMSSDSTAADARPCELSNVIYRSITIHGLRDPELHHEVMRVATSPRSLCERNSLHMAAGGVVYNNVNGLYPAIWGRKLPVSGHPIYIMAKAYTDMVGTNGSKHDCNCHDCPSKPHSVDHLLMIPLVNEERDARRTFLSPHSFRDLHSRLRDNGQWPNWSSELVSLDQVMEQGSAMISWCQRMDWAAQIADMIANLSRERLLLCDLHPSRILINATSRSAILSVGKVQWTYGKERFHSGAPCFIDVQCEACFKTSKSQSMDWLPEASCNQDTKKCMGFDGSSQARAAAVNILQPLLQGLPNTDGIRQQVQLALAMAIRPRDLNTTLADGSHAEKLRSAFMEMRDEHDTELCATSKGGDTTSKLLLLASQLNFRQNVARQRLMLS